MTHMIQATRCSFEVTVLGSARQHLGPQLYKRRDVVITELVANAWDTGATERPIEVPRASAYNFATRTISVNHNGVGLSAGQVDEDYLVIGGNRRASSQQAPAGGVQSVEQYEQVRKAS